MKKGVIALILLVLPSVYAASNWVDDPSNCPTSYQSQTCSGSDVVCGYDDPITYCYDPSSISPPGSYEEGTTSHNSSLGGGYIIDCYDYDGSAPHCDDGGTFWCNRNTTCHNTPVFRQTNCTASVWAQSTCGHCRSGYFNCYGDTNCESTSTSDCDGGYDNTRYNTSTCGDGDAGGTCICESNYFECDGSILDADGCEFYGGGSGSGTCGSNTGWYVYEQCLNSSAANCTATGSRASNLDCDDDDGDAVNTTCNGANGCEVTDGGACTVGSLSGTYNGCTCEVDPMDVYTQRWHNDSTSYPMMIFTQFSTGAFVFFNKSDDSTNVSIENNGSLLTSGEVYAEQYFWNNGTEVGGGSTYTATHPWLILIGTAFSFNDTHLVSHGYLNTSNPALNSSIDNRTASETYTAFLINTTDGTLDDGNLTSTQSLEDEDSYNVSEVAPGGITIWVNFTNVTTFNSILLNIYYEGGGGHEINLELYNFVDSTWELKHEITDMSNFTQTVIPVLDPTNHINGSNVSLRFDHQQSGNPSHNLYIDYVALQRGTTTLTSNEHDSLGGRDNKVNHPWAMPTDASRAFNANLNGTSANFTGDVFAGSFNTSNWGNVTITESQVSDLSHVVDTNETTKMDEIYTEITTNSSDWTQAYLWDDHSTQGYLTTITETDPEYSAALPQLHNITNVTVIQQSVALAQGKTYCYSGANDTAPCISYDGTNFLIETGFVNITVNSTTYNATTNTGSFLILE